MNSKQLCKLIPGQSKTDARRVYLALDRHFRDVSRDPNACPHCIPYARYGVLHITGDYINHITNLVNDTKHVKVHDIATQIDILTSGASKEKLLTIDEVALRRHCVTFLLIQEQLLRRERVA